ncbi:hypothetical protein O6H91_05G001400 [Diphasiastrum complanatum]|uniref:Uncharacterized protein n=1 Tax=Diphasiastrum complanatum TaxID=34168 RepID=A0ACC2DKW1_DIPCM|nr:hypothetical protein O6H91_05G001400 [Diphasiastrum complanatum]
MACALFLISARKGLQHQRRDCVLTQLRKNYLETNCVSNRTHPKIEAFRSRSSKCLRKSWPIGALDRGNHLMFEIRHALEITGRSVASIRADAAVRGYVRWKNWSGISCFRGHGLPPVGRIVSAMSLACARFHVVPRILAVIVSKAAWDHRFTVEAEPLHMIGPLSSNVEYQPIFLIFLLSSLLEAFALLIRAVYLATLFAPAIITAPFADSFEGAYRHIWLKLVHHSLEHAGAAFIKWGQWAATRPDLFSSDLCQELSKLHTKAPAHRFSETRQIVEGAFGRNINDIFENFEEEPVASGSIAQVHRAVLKLQYPGQKLKQTMVAVKVRHPGVSIVIRRDFVLMNGIAKLSSLLPGLRWLRLDESVQQFAVFMMTQVDLAREAAHLSRFIYNFRSCKDVSFPKPLYPLVHPAVLVETYEQGESVAHFVDRPGKTHINSALAKIGTHTLLKMMLVDNFVHADLHPGNILVRLKSGRQSSMKGLFSSRPHVVLLDVGMTAELSQKDRATLLDFFKAVAVTDGRKAAESTLQFSHAQSCPDPKAFIKDVEESFQYWKKTGDEVHTGECIQELLEQVRRHKVNIDGDVCTVIVTTLVLEGWQRKLDPDYNVMETLHSLLFKAEWASSLSYTIDNLMAP